jgi:plasmid maintenance system antidote protein VapI
LTQIAAASLMGVDQPKVSALLNGRLANFSSDRLMRLLTTLGQDVEIVLRAEAHSRARGKVRVLAEDRRRVARRVGITGCIAAALPPTTSIATGYLT